QLFQFGLRHHLSNLRAQCIAVLRLSERKRKVLQQNMRPCIQRQRGPIKAQSHVVADEFDCRKLLPFDCTDVHRYCAPMACAAASICAFVVSSVAHHSSAFSPSSGYHLLSASPPTISFVSSFAFTLSAEAGSATANSLKLGAENSGFAPALANASRR